MELLEDKQLGWQAVYDVVCTSEEQVLNMRTWLKDRGGVSVFISHDLSSAGRYMYTPGDRKDERPHWSMFLVEVVTDPKRFNVQVEHVRYSKPPKEEKKSWKYDKSRRDWYRMVPATLEEMDA